MQTSTATDAPGLIMGERQDIQKQRSRAVRTAWVLAAVASLIFIVFILSGVLGS